jgi:hypothetical protein
VYVGVTRGRDSVLLTIDTSRPYRHPFLRELVETPDVGEHEALELWLADAAGACTSPELRDRLTARLAEIELLYPELLPDPQEGRPGTAAPNDRG